MTHEGDVPAMPCEETYYDAHGSQRIGGYLNVGLSKREAAALALRVPDSGTPWIDDMIRKSLRAEFAKAALGPEFDAVYMEARDRGWQPEWRAAAAVNALAIADAMLAELEKGR